MRPAFLLALSLFAASARGQSWTGPEYAGTFTDPDLDEVSGLAASRTQPGLYWAQDDSGNGNKLMLIRADGTRLATVGTDGATNVDWEDLVSFDQNGRHYLLLADTGDNGGIRKTLTLYVFEEPAQVREGDSIKVSWRIDFRWPDGARDCEAAFVDVADNAVYLVSKKRVPPELFRLPLHPGSGLQVAQKLATLPGIDQPTEQDLTRNPIYGRYRSQITAADLSPDGRTLAVLNYHSIYLWQRPSPTTPWPRVMQKSPKVLRFPWLPQAEALAFSLDGRELIIGSEQRPSPLLRYRLKP